MLERDYLELHILWAGKELWGFNWLEHVTAIPAPLALMTGYKANDMVNGTMQSWFCFSSVGNFFCIFGIMNKGM